MVVIVRKFIHPLGIHLASSKRGFAKVTSCLPTVILLNHFFPGRKVELPALRDALSLLCRGAKVHPKGSLLLFRSDLNHREMLQELPQPWECTHRGQVVQRSVSTDFSTFPLKWWLIRCLCIYERVVNKMFVYPGLNNFKMHWPATSSLWEAWGTARNSLVFSEGCFIYGVHGCCHSRPC